MPKSTKNLQSDALIVSGRNVQPTTQVTSACALVAPNTYRITLQLTLLGGDTIGRMRRVGITHRADCHALTPGDAMAIALQSARSKYVAFRTIDTSAIALS